MKTCSTCHIEQDRTMFYKRSKSKDGLTGTCRTCKRHQSAKWGAANPDRKAANNKEWYKQNKDRANQVQKQWYEQNKESRRESIAAWQLLNAEKMEKYYADYREVNADAERQRVDVWRRNNPIEHKDSAMRYCHMRRSIEFGVVDTLSEEMPNWWSRLLEAYGGACLKCGTLDNISVEHVVPLSKGGGHTWENLSLLCVPCNNENKGKEIDYRTVLLAL